MENKRKKMPKMTVKDREEFYDAMLRADKEVVLHYIQKRPKILKSRLALVAHSIEWTQYVNVLQPWVSPKSNIETQISLEIPIMNWVCISRNFSLLEDLLKLNCRVDVCDELGFTPLHLAILMDFTEAFRVLLKAGANIRNVTHECVTPVMVAARKTKPTDDSLEILRQVLELCRFDFVNRQDRQDNTAVYYATSVSWKEAVKELIKHGADLQISNNRTWAPLHLAVRHNDYELTKILVGAGCLVNMRDHNATTPLHLCCRLANTSRAAEQICKLLLSSGADLASSDHHGFPPIFLTIVSKSPICAKMILRRTRPSDLQMAYILHSPSALSDDESMRFSALEWALVNYNPVCDDLGESYLKIIKMLLLAGHGVSRNCFVRDMGYEYRTVLYDQIMNLMYMRRWFPFTLREFCRVSIRSSLRTLAPETVLGMSELPLPLKEFVSLKELDEVV